ncbi:hypothetical protein JZ751_018885 [Albula glossodonta]|uniref:Uncharacterized protein n=1 Tax=Albula glossodonta TaxID=121402 RepID=A0A8T2MTU3_9TELE|nr:hypothetical protein JZ751_018885 [Albula glossodonta]
MRLSMRWQITSRTLWMSLLRHRTMTWSFPSGSPLRQVDPNATTGRANAGCTRTMASACTASSLESSLPSSTSTLTCQT